MAGTGTPVRWQELTWEQVEGLRKNGVDLAILPVGATEQHGLHLPLGVDTLSAVAVAEGVSARTGFPVLPPLPVGCSLGHSKRWPGTLSLRPETLARVVYEIAEWVEAAGFKRLVILNGHVTNWAPLRCALENVRADFPEVRIALRSIWEITRDIGALYFKDGGTNFHANAAETSLMLHLHPHLVDMSKARDEPNRSGCCFFSYTVEKESVNGVCGNPTLATAEQGSLLLEACIAAFSDQLTKAQQERTPLEEMPPAD